MNICISRYGTPYGGGPPPPQEQQQQQQVVVVNGGQQAQPVIIQPHESFIGQMILACFVLWCCNCLFGLIAFILAGKYHRCVMTNRESGQIPGEI